MNQIPRVIVSRRVNTRNPCCQLLSGDWLGQQIRLRQAKSKLISLSQTPTLDEARLTKAPQIRHNCTSKSSTKLGDLTAEAKLAASPVVGCFIVSFTQGGRNSKIEVHSVVGHPFFSLSPKPPASLVQPCKTVLLFVGKFCSKFFFPSRFR